MASVTQIQPHKAHKRSTKTAVTPQTTPNPSHVLKTPAISHKMQPTLKIPIHFPNPRIRLPKTQLRIPKIQRILRTQDLCKVLRLHKMLRLLRLGLHKRALGRPVEVLMRKLVCGDLLLHTVLKGEVVAGK